MARRPGPEFCPYCSAPLKVVDVKPLIGGLEQKQFGEIRYFACTRAPECRYTREQLIEFDG